MVRMFYQEEEGWDMEDYRVRSFISDQEHSKETLCVH